MDIRPALNLYNPGYKMGMAAPYDYFLKLQGYSSGLTDTNGLILDHSVHSRGALAGIPRDHSVHNRYSLGRGWGWQNMIPLGAEAINRAVNSGNSGMGQGIDFTSIINRGIDVVGSIFAKAPSPYISPNDPRFKQAPQNVYMYTPPPPGYVPPPGVPAPTGVPSTGVGVQLSQSTLLLLGGAILIFLVARK